MLFCRYFLRYIANNLTCEKAYPIGPIMSEGGDLLLFGETDKKLVIYDTVKEEDVFTFDFEKDYKDSKLGNLLYITYSL